MLSTRVPLPEAIDRLIAVSAGPSASEAFASSSACVMRRGPLSSAIEASTTGVVTGESFSGVMSRLAVVATGAAMPSVTAKSKETSCLVGGRRVAPDAVVDVDESAGAAGDRQIDRCQRGAVGIGGIRQQLGQRDEARPAVLRDRSQHLRRGHRRIVLGRDVEAGRRRIRRGDAVDHGVVEGDVGVVVGRRRGAPGAVVVVDESAGAAGDRQVDRSQRGAVRVGGVGRQLALRDEAAPAVLRDVAEHDRRRHRRIVIGRDVEARHPRNRSGDAVVTA